jgi:DNA polymerase IV
MIFVPSRCVHKGRSDSDGIIHELWRAANEMLAHRLPAGHLPVRLIGMGVSGLDDTGLVQGMLFDGEE